MLTRVQVARLGCMKDWKTGSNYHHVIPLCRSPNRLIGWSMCLFTDVGRFLLGCIRGVPAATSAGKWQRSAPSLDPPSRPR